MRSYTGDIGALAATHPPFLLSYKLSWILQSSETTCRWLLILIASTHWLSWCVRRKIPHLSDTMSLGSWWVSEQPWAHRARKEAAEQLQGFRCFCGKERLGIWVIWGKSSYSSCHGGLSNFTMVLANQALPRRLKHPMLETSSKRPQQSQWSALRKVKGTFHRAFLMGY